MNYNDLFIILGLIVLLMVVPLILLKIDKSNTILEWLSSFYKSISLILISCLVIAVVIGGLYFLVLGIPYFLLIWGENNLSQFLYYFLIALSFVYFLLLLRWTGKKGFYYQIEKLYLKLGIKKMVFLVPLVVIIGLIGLGIACFSALTAAFSDNSIFTFCTAIEKPKMIKVLDFYSWHFVDLIPQIKVADTLNWEEPYNKLYNNGVAALLLLFKSIMAYIVIDRFYIWNKWRKESHVPNN